MTNVLNDLVEYSYGFNMKLFGVPELAPLGREQVIDTSKLCVQIFKGYKGAADIDADIDIAYRAPSRKPKPGKAKPINCIFVRSLARNEVMALRQEIRNVDPKAVGLEGLGDLTNGQIMDHLISKDARIIYRSKEVQVEIRVFLIVC